MDKSATGEFGRREFLIGAASVAALVSTPLPALAQSPAPFTVPPLGYAPSDLEPHIDTTTMSIHHDKHHAAYVKNLNDALAKKPGDYSSWPIEKLVAAWGTLPNELQSPVRNNGGGHYNHSLFWKMIGPAAKTGKASTELARAIDHEFGNWQSFQTAFNSAAMARFGSGWVWLARTPEGKVTLVSSANQDNPVSDGHQPLLGIDLWEHAYYLKHQNVRKDYVDAWWNVVQWDYVNQRFSSKSTAV